jgi:hypothetical protein
MYPRLVSNSQSSCLSLKSAGITGMYHCTTLERFLTQNRISYFGAFPNSPELNSNAFGNFSKDTIHPKNKQMPVFTTMCHRLPEGRCRSTWD